MQQTKANKKAYETYFERKKWWIFVIISFKHVSIFKAALFQNITPSVDQLQNYNWPEFLTSSLCSSASYASQQMQIIIYYRAVSLATTIVVSRSLSRCIYSSPITVCGENKSIMLALTGGNWQKWKRVFLTCPCHEIYRDETVGLKSCKNTWKITIFVKMWNLGQYRENSIFCQ